MKIIDTSAIFFWQEETDERELALNFDNINSKEQKELADDDLCIAELLLSVFTSPKKLQKKLNLDTKTKKALCRKVRQGTMEAVEKYQKVLIYDDNEKMDDDLNKRLKKTHNTKFQQKEAEKTGINILEKEDIHILNKGIKYPPEETSPYNAVRYHKQSNTYRNMKNAVTVAQKAKHNLEQELEKKSENKKHEKQHPVKWWC